MDPLIWPMAIFLTAVCVSRIWAGTWRERGLDAFNFSKADFERRVQLQRELDAEQRKQRDEDARRTARAN